VPGAPFTIRMQDPLKQGLKRHVRDLNPAYSTIRMQDPLKQGLKHGIVLLTLTKPSDSNARSTKTRIETFLLNLFLSRALQVFECKIH